MKLINRLKTFFGTNEGSNNGPFFGFGEYGNSFFLPSLGDGWQNNLNVGIQNAHEAVPAVNAAGTAYARAVSTCHIGHYIVRGDGGHEKQDRSAIASLLRNPNDYETFPQYIFNTLTEFMFRGESISLLLRNGRAEVTAMHRIRHGNWQIYIDPETSAVFYGVSANGNPLLPNELDYLIPARDILHFRQYTPRHPLIGETAVKAAAIAIGINVALSESQIAFFKQMRRPSGILSTDLRLTKEQMTQLRSAFDQQSDLMNRGGVPILHSGMKFQTLGITSQDSELIQAQRMTIEDIARVFGVPLPILGDLSKATLNNAETLINHWLSLGLGSLLENLERSFEKALRLPNSQRIEFDTTPLLRSDFVTRVDGLTKAVQGGLMAVNEARRREGLSAVEFGDEPMLQAQMVPISYAAQQTVPTVAPEEISEPTPNNDHDEENNNDQQDTKVDPDVTRALVQSKMLNKWKKIA